MGRFSDIMRAEQLMVQKRALDDYNRLDPVARAAAYATAAAVGGGKRLRVGKQPGWVKLFGSDDGYVSCNLLSGNNLNGDATTGETDTGLITQLTGAVIGDGRYAVTTKPSAAGNSIVSGADMQGKLAKVFLTKKDGTKHARVSRFTRRPYKAPTTNTVSCVFGALVGGTAATATYAAAVAALRAALIQPGAENLALRFKPQGNIGIE
jgi:hypothetical protein